MPPRPRFRLVYKPFELSDQSLLLVASGPQQCTRRRSYYELDWAIFLLFHPLAVSIPGCLQKISQDRVQGVLIAPLWPTQTWFPVLLQQLCDQPWILPPRPDLLEHPSRSGPHPLHGNLHLIVCPVSGDPSAIITLQRRLPIFLWHPGGEALKKTVCHIR